MRLFSALNVLGWIIVMPVLLVTVMSPFVNFSAWPDALADRANGTQVALLPPRLSEHGSLPQLTEHPQPSAAVPAHREIAVTFTPASAPATRSLRQPSAPARRGDSAPAGSRRPAPRRNARPVPRTPVPAAPAVELVSPSPPTAGPQRPQPAPARPDRPAQPAPDKPGRPAQPAPDKPGRPADPGHGRPARPAPAKDPKPPPGNAEARGKAHPEQGGPGKGDERGGGHGRP